MSLPPQRYDVPSGKVGRLFISALTRELNGVIERSWNAEKFIVFSSVILQRSPDAKRARDIRRRIENRLEAWAQNKFDMLVQDTVRTSKSLISRKKRGMSEEQVSKTYTRLVLQGKLRSAVRFVTERDQGGLLDGDDIDVKSGLPVHQVLESKHPDAMIPEIGALEHYDSVPEMLDLDVTCDTVETVSKKMAGAAGTGGTDAIALQHWLLRFEDESLKL